FRVVVAGDVQGPSTPSGSSAIQTISLPAIDSPNAERDRRRILASTCATLQPRVIVVEQYPFGDMHLGGEILHLLDAAAMNIRTPLIVSSVRQLPESDTLSRVEIHSARSAAEAYFDAVLVHTDPTISRLPDDGLESDPRWSAPV